MNLLLLGPQDVVAPGRARISGRRLEHMREILDVQVGGTLRVGIRDGQVGEATVESLEPNGAELTFALEADPPPASPIAVALALPRPPVLRRVLSQITTFGVKDIYLFGANRVEKSYWQSPALAPEAIDAQLVLGLEQARDTKVPRVHLHPRFRPFAEDVLAPMLGSGEIPAYVGHPGARRPCPHAAAGPAVLVVGPEGGFVPFEVDRLQAVGAAVVSAGPRVFRTETAVIALLGRLTP